MSLPVALSVWVLLPDYPHNTKSWYITEEDKEIALQRSARSGKAEITGILDLKLVKRMFGNWRWWVLCISTSPLTFLSHFRNFRIRKKLTSNVVVYIFVSFFREF